MFNQNEKLPKTIDEAAELVISLMGNEAKNAIRDTPFYNLHQFHHGFGAFIRSQCGLLKGNKELLKSCGGEWVHPDSASGRIMSKVWQKLNNYSDKDVEELPSMVVLKEVVKRLKNRQNEV